MGAWRNDCARNMASVVRIIINAPGSLLVFLCRLDRGGGGGSGKTGILYEHGRRRFIVVPLINPLRRRPMAQSRELRLRRANLENHHKTCQEATYSPHQMLCIMKVFMFARKKVDWH